MSLSCSCDYELEPEPGMWVHRYRDISDFKKLNTSKRKRCCSCNNLINIGAICVEYPRYRYPHNEIEARIHGDTYFDMCYEPDIKIASHYHCEKCAEIWLNLTDAGYDCLSPDENMIESLKEYHKLSKRED